MLCYAGCMSETRKPLQLPVVGQRFGRWVVSGDLTYSYAGRQARLAAPCICDCGTERIVLVQTLRRTDRANLSCGCWKRELTATLVTRTRWKDSHGRAGGAKDDLYRLWLRINQRCSYEAAHNYKYYGGRGISVWEQWRRDAGAFIAYIENELGPCPPGKSLDRVNNDGNYEPGNLRWATRSEQVRNRRASRLPD